MAVKPVQLIEWIIAVDKEPTPLFLLDSLLESDAAALVTGPATRGYKTWFLFQVAMCLASGKSCSLLKPTIEEGVPVLVLELEGPRKPTRNRFAMLENGSGISLEKDCGNRFWFLHRPTFFLDSAENIAEIARFIQEKNIKFVGIDTLAKAIRGDENSAKDIGDAMRGIDQLRKAGTGCSVMYLHHLHKPNYQVQDEDIDSESRGSSALAGFYDEHFAIRKKFISQKYLDLTLRANQMEEQYFTIQWHIDKEKNSAVLDMKKVDDTKLSQEFLDSCMIKLVAERPYSKNDLQQLWGVPKITVTTVIDQLVEEGVLEQSGTRKWKIK